MHNRSYSLSRRDLLSLGLGVSTLLPFSVASANTLNTQAHIVILGGGAAGMAMANRLTKRLRGGIITLVEPRETHHYQPGWTMVASGVWGLGSGSLI
jgi:sulfide:quinone oxidoreductase